VNAVNSEHEKNVSNDSWRLDQLEKSTAKKDHAFNKFGTGKENCDSYEDVTFWSLNLWGSLGISNMCTTVCALIHFCVFVQLCLCLLS
jgi:hypothetical protein